MIDRDREASSQRGRVRLDHQRNLQPFADLRQHGHAELPAAVGDHEVDDFGRHLFGGADEIAFIFAVFGIDDDDDLPAANSGDSVVNRRKMARHASVAPVDHYKRAALCYQGAQVNAAWG